MEDGKSTTSMMIYHILDKLGKKVQVGGNIGSRGVLDFELSDQDIIFIIELSSYQIELSPNIKPDIGILLNISPDHLDRHGDMDKYIDIKFDIFNLNFRYFLIIKLFIQQTAFTYRSIQI